MQVRDASNFLQKQLASAGQIWTWIVPKIRRKLEIAQFLLEELVAVKKSNRLTLWVNFELMKELSPLKLEMGEDDKLGRIDQILPSRAPKFEGLLLFQPKF